MTTPDNPTAATPIAWPQTTPGTPVAVAVDTLRVIDDVATAASGPTLRAHLLTLLLDASAFLPLIPAWIDLPENSATMATLGALVFAVGGHLYAWYQAKQSMIAHQAMLTAAASRGRHAAR